MRILLAAITALILFSGANSPVRAHALQPGFLELQALGPDTWRVYWKKPAVSGNPMEIEAVLPGNCDQLRASDTVLDGGAYVSRWVANCVGGLMGETIFIEGLEKTRTDVLVRYQISPENRTETRRLTASEPSFIVPEPRGWIGVMTAYIGLGVEHILEGWDHLMFVFALVLLVRDWRMLVGAVTAFTVAHSITLAASVLGLVYIPIPPVEAIIALSIVFLAMEIAKGGGRGDRLSERFPWIVSFLFGLLHGFGFASALLDIGLPEGEVPLALLAFNIGVELGQLAFIVVVLALGNICYRLYPRFKALAWQPGSPGIMFASYAMGGIASYWMIERISGF